MIEFNNRDLMHRHGAWRLKFNLSDNIEGPTTGRVWYLEYYINGVIEGEYITIRGDVDFGISYEH